VIIGLPLGLQAAVVNQAYDVLKKPLRRAHYIVRRAVVLVALLLLLPPPPPLSHLLGCCSASRALYLPSLHPSFFLVPSWVQLNNAGYGACEGMTITDPEVSGRVQSRGGRALAR